MSAKLLILAILLVYITNCMGTKIGFEDSLLQLIQADVKMNSEEADISTRIEEKSDFFPSRIVKLVFFWIKRRFLLYFAANKSMCYSGLSGHCKMKEYSQYCKVTEEICPALRTFEVFEFLL